jgi:predicted dehydrogenase
VDTIGVHIMDAACWLLNSAVTSVSARLDTFFVERKVAGGRVVPVTNDDSFSATLRFEQPIVASIQAMYVTRLPLQRIEVHGDRGALVAPDSTTLLGGQDGGTLLPVPVDERLKPASGWSPDGPPLLAPFTELAGRVVARIRGEPGGQFPTFEDGVRAQRLLDAVYRSADSGCAIEL